MFFNDVLSSILSCCSKLTGLSFFCKHILLNCTHAIFHLMYSDTYGFPLTVYWHPITSTIFCNVVGFSSKFAISLRQCLGCMIGVFLWCLAVSILKVVKGKLTPSFCRARVLSWACSSRFTNPNVWVWLSRTIWQILICWHGQCHELFSISESSSTVSPLLMPHGSLLCIELRLFYDCGAMCPH